MRYFCSPQHTDSAFYPIILQLERASTFERHDLPESKLEKIISLLGSAAEQHTDVQLLAELLSIPTGNRFSALNWSPQRKKEKIFEALLRQLDIRSRQQPVLLVYEDVHWIDPSSRELLDMTVDCVARLPAPRHDRAALAATAGELAALCEDQSLPPPRSAAEMFNGWVMAHSGKVSEGILLVERGLSAWQRMGIQQFLPRSHCLLAEAYLAGQRYTEGLAQVTLALKAAEQTGVHYYDALIYHLRALCLVHVEGMNGDNVEADLKTAIKIAQAQTAKGLEPPATVSLARLWHDLGKQQQARELLAPVYDSFTEGFGTHDLQETKTLLVELAS
jgi:hypothetical protein